MRLRPLRLSTLVLGGVLVSVAAATSSLADPPETATGTVLIDPSSFQFSMQEPTGPVERFSFSFRSTVLGDLPGAASESFDCLQAGGAVHCRGGGTTVGADGSSGVVRAVLTCTPLPELACGGKSQGRGTTADGQKRIWMSDISPAGPFRATYVARVVEGGG